MTKKIVILGGSGDARVIYSYIEDAKAAGHNIQALGFLDDNASAAVFDLPRLGALSSWNNLDQEVVFIQALLSVGRMQPRAELIDGLRIPIERYATLIHPTATVSKFATMGLGVVISPHAVIQAGATIGKHVHIRAGANLGHDTHTGNYCNIGPNAVLCGYSTVGNYSFLGPNAVVRDSVQVGANVTIAAGAVVLKEAAQGTWLGNPAKRIV
jgi:acetyltransferase EpsM